MDRKLKVLMLNGSPREKGNIALAFSEADNSEDPNAFAGYIAAKYNGEFKCIIPKVMEKITSDM